MTGNIAYLSLLFYCLSTCIVAGNWDDAVNCEDHWYYFDGRCYLVSSVKDLKTRDTALIWCTTLMASLAEIESEDEFEFIINLAKKSSPSNFRIFWTGAEYKDIGGGVWVWQTSWEPVASEAWMFGKPNIEKPGVVAGLGVKPGAEVGLISTYKSYKHPYICEKVATKSQ